MASFTVEYLDPCEEEASKKSLSNKQNIINKFESIDWFQHKKDVIYSHNAPDEGFLHGNALHDYYYFSVRYLDHNQHPFDLNIVAAISDGSIGTKSNVRFDVEFRRPKLEATSKFFQLFGKAKEKLNPEYMSHAKDFTIEEVSKLMGEFMSFKNDLVESKINIEGYLY